MKLRNKKTGKIIEARTIRFGDAKTEDGMAWKSYTPMVDSIAELNEEWEDAEDINVPIIKDEKIRKAVRAWAEAIEINDNKVAFNRYSNGFSYMENEGLFSNINFDGRAFNFVDGKLYTITELCGEEEK